MSREGSQTRGALAYLLIGGALAATVAAFAYVGCWSNEAWRASVFSLLGVAALTLVASLAVFITALLAWRMPFRNRRLVRSALLAAAGAAVFASPFALTEHVWGPAQGRRLEQARKERRDADSPTKEGDAAPAFEVVTEDGAMFALGEQRGKVVVVNFYAAWCAPCLRELPHLQGLWDEHKHRADFALIVIGREETDEAVKGFKAGRGFSFPMAADPEGAVYALFAKEVIPRTYIISRDGKVCLSTAGFAGEEQFAEIRTALRRELTN